MSDLASLMSGGVLRRSCAGEASWSVRETMVVRLPGVAIWVGLHGGRRWDPASIGGRPDLANEREVQTRF
jgi:hypothetical protein